MSDSLNVRWEYTAFYCDIDSGEDEQKTFIKKANKLGQDGWELTVVAMDAFCVFKRRLP